MIIGLSEGGAVVGSIERIDFLDASSTVHANVPVMILREATREEWLQTHPFPSAPELLAMRLQQFPRTVFYEVSVD